MRFDGLDLNLLVAFQALIEESSVSGAARRLHLTQPAVSGALGRLREYFQDELLELHGRKMKPTPKAEALYDPVFRALLQIRGEITRVGSFDPANSNRHFLIVASDYAFTIGLADLIAEAAMVAPMVTFEVIPPSDLAMDRLRRAEVDLAITVEPYAIPSFPALELWKDTAVIISWKGAGYTTISKDVFFQAGHAIGTFGPDRRRSITDEYIGTLDQERRIELLLPNFNDLCRGVIGTNRLATMHRRYAEYLAKHFPIRISETWKPFPEIVQLAQWHKVRESDPGINWLLQKLCKL